MTKLAGTSALALLAALAACGSPAQPSQDSAPAAEMAMDGPFAQSELAMDKALKVAVGVDAADTWVKKMIAHHQGAIDMSRIVLGLKPTAEVAKMAQMSIENQGAEIEALKALVRSGAADPASAKLYEAAMNQMHDEIMAASGATSSETYLAKMLAHHRGAIAMSEIALANGAAGAVRTKIEETRTEQLQEAARVEAMQRGEPMATQAQAKPAPIASTPAVRPAAPKPAPAKPAAAKPAPEPTAEPKASPTCLPEHRAAGHC